MRNNISRVCGLVFTVLGLFYSLPLRASFVDSWAASYYASPTYTGNLADFSHVSIDFCNNKDQYGIVAPYRKTYQAGLPMILCLWINNKDQAPVLVLLSLGSYYSSGASQDWWDLLPWQCSHAAGFDHDYSIFNHNSLLASWNTALVLVSGHSYQQFFFHIQPQTFADIEHVEGCIRAWEYVPPHRPKQRMWLFTVNLVRVRPFSLIFDTNTSVINPMLFPHNLPAKNLLKNSFYHLSKLNPRSFLLQYMVINTWNSSFVFVSSWALSSFGTIVHFSGDYDLPPQSSVVISHQLPINLLSFWRYSLYLNDSSLDLSLKNLTWQPRLRFPFHKQFFSFPRMIYFFALLIIILYNVHAWFHYLKWRKTRTHSRKNFIKTKAHEET